MNEDILFDMEQSEKTVPDDTEIIGTDTEYSENDVVSGTDSADSDSTVSDNDGSDTVITDTVDTDGTVITETVIQNVETYYSEELGGYPVVVVRDVSGDYDTSLTADYSDYYTTLSTTWENYFSGVLANMGGTDYVAYCLRDYVSSSYSSYVDHYVMYYDLEVENDSLVSGSYPYLDIYKSGNSYVCSEGTGTLSSVPFPSYGSFGTLSDLRKGVSHDETWAVLFAVGFAVVYSVCTRLFDNVRSLCDRC